MSDIARVYPPGKELAIGNQNLAVVAQAGKEPTVVRPSGKELAIGNQDLAR